MKTYSTLLLALLYCFLLHAQDLDKNAALDAMIREGMEDWKIPGLAAVVVRGDSILFEKVYGVKNLESGEKVDRNTLFHMGSTTKALVAIALGMLVDDGKIKWRDKVRDHLPSFRLSDTYITEEARVQDLLTHNLGMSPFDLIWLLDHTNTADAIQRYGKAEKGYPIRSGFWYNNMLYAVAGELIGEVSGMDWRDFIQKRLLQPLQMERTLTRSSDITKQGNFVTPYYNHNEDGIQRVPYIHADEVGAAGMMWSSIADIGNYLKFLAGDGIFQSDTLVSKKTFQYLFKPHAIIPYHNYPAQDLVNPNWNTYGLGWFQQDYRGHKLDYHTGSLTGLSAIAGILHDKDLAVYVFSNMDHAELRHAILLKTMDLYGFDDNERDWHQEIFDKYESLRKQREKNRQEFEASRVQGTSPTHPLAAFAGRYNHPMAGDLRIIQENKQLFIQINEFEKLPLTHWHYNLFRSDLFPPLQAPLDIQFTVDNKGKIKAIVLGSEEFIKKEGTQDGG